jgi:hypothetical protein
MNRRAFLKLAGAALGAVAARVRLPLRLEQEGGIVPDPTVAILDAEGDFWMGGKTGTLYKIGEAIGIGEDGRLVYLDEDGRLTGYAGSIHLSDTAHDRLFTIQM